MTQPMLAERVGVSVPTIGKLENGDPSTSFATMLRVLTVLGMAADIDLLAAQNTVGRSLQDNELKRPMPRRADAASAIAKTAGRKPDAKPPTSKAAMRKKP